MKKAAVILGAGANVDAYNGLGQQPPWPAPLAKDLFGRWASDHEQFFQVLDAYPGARYIASQITPKLNQGFLAIERELARYANHHNPQMRLYFRHVPPYLRDVIQQFSNVYGAMTGTISNLIHELMVEPTESHEVAFITLNYDTILEMELARLSSKEYRFESLADYNAKGRQAGVYKIHGSINWYRILREYPLSGNVNQKWSDVALDAPDSSFIGPVFFRDGLSHTTIFHDDGKLRAWLYPVLTAPVAGKSSSTIACPNDQTIRLHNWLSDCQKYLIIGTSGLDLDLMQLLKNGIQYARVVHYVSKGDVDDVQQRFRENVPAISAMERLMMRPDVSLWKENNGLLSYLSSNAIKKFVEA